MNKQHYFPILKTADIVTCLDQLNVKVGEADIQKPSQNTKLRMFEILGSTIMDIKYGQLTPSMQQEGLVERILEETTDYPELHQDSLKMMMFFRQFSKVLRSIGVKNFSLKDLTSPEAPRLRIILSAIINYARFREERYDLYDELSAQTDKLTNLKNTLLEEKNSFTEGLNSIKLQRSEEEPQVQHFTITNKDLAENLKNLKASGDAANSAISKMKQDKTDIQDRLQNTQIMLQHAKQDAARLRSRIVRNPEQLKRAIHDMNASFQALKATVTASERQQREIQMKIENLNLVEQDLSSCVKLLEECDSEYRALEEVNQKAYAEKDLLERKHAECREYQIKEQQLKRQEIAAQEKLNRLNNQLALKRDGMENKLLKYREEWEELGAVDAETQEQFDEFARQISELKSKIHEVKKAYDQEMASNVNAVATLKDDLRIFMSDFSQGMTQMETV